MRLRSLGVKALVFVTVCAMFVLAVEIGFRVAVSSSWQICAGLRDPSAYADYFSDDDYWILYYRFGGAHRPPRHPHPVLGWTGEFNRGTLRHRKTKRLAGCRPVLLYGDSFASCATPKNDCFQGILNADPEFTAEHYLLNYGVGGYGVDQIYLLFENSVDLYDNPFVIMSVMVYDLDRSVLSVRGGQKPRFEVVDDELVLAGTPIDPDPGHFFAEHPPSFHSYLLRMMMMEGWWPRSLTGYWSEAEKTAAKTAVNEKLLRKIVAGLEDRKLEHAFLVFHPAWQIQSPANWRDELVYDVFGSTDATVISSKEIILADLERRHVSFDYDTYFITGNGHPSQYQNALICDRIRELMLENS